jgi:DNA-binding beta-propeller fold protein YncE
MNENTRTSDDFSLGYYCGNRATGTLAVIRRVDGRTQVEKIPTAAESGLAQELKPVFVGLGEERQVILLDPASREILVQNSFPADAFPAHIYEDPGSTRRWFMNDGDKQTGNDRLNCGEAGSSVTVIDNVDSAGARFLKTICVGRGHHQAAYTAPSAGAPDVPRRAYISNLKDGTLSVIGNDPARPAEFLRLIDTIDLCEPEREEGGITAAPNNAFPHGLVYSELTGRLYNLNNGYGTIAVIDPRSNRIESRLPFKGNSNLFMVPGGRYIIGRGADRKSDPNHAIAHLTVLDVQSLEIVDRLALPDIYVSKYYFNPEGTRLYLTTSSSGSPEQQANLKQDALLVIDLTTLPRLALRSELRLGTPSGSLAFVRDAGGSRVFSSNGAAGTVVVVDGESDEIVETIEVGPELAHSRVWTLR